MSGQNVALLGLGAMGTMLGQTLAGAGHHLTVWNRGKARADIFAEICAVAETPLAACESADLVLTCLANFAATYAVLDNAEIKSALSGKTLVNLSTATPAETEAFGVWAAAANITYLDAKIGAVPSGIGGDMTVIFYAGDAAAFKRYEPVLKCLAGRTTFVGEALDRAVMGDFAFLSVYFAGTIGLLHGAAFCKATGMDIKQYFSLSTSFLKEVADRAVSFEKMVLEGAYTDVQSALKTDLAGAVLLAETAKAAGLSALFPEAIISVLRDGVTRGYANLDTAALVECFLAK